MGFEHPPSLFLKKDTKNSKKPLGKTAFYDPGQKSITIYVTNRHPKDILRSFAHELVHHTQNLRGDLSPEKCGNMGNNYAQSNKHMRNMEKEAYLIGNMCFRDWEDGLPEEDMRKYKLAESKFLKENKKVNKETLKEMIRKTLFEQMSDEELIDYAQRNTALKNTGAYRAAVKRVKNKQAAAGAKKRKDFFTKGLAQADVNAKRAKEAEARRVKASLEKQKQQRLDALDNPSKGATTDYLKRLGAAGAAPLARRKKEKEALAKAFDDQIADLDRAKTKADVVAIAKQGVGAKLPSSSGRKTNVNVDTAIVSSTPSAGISPTADQGPPAPPVDQGPPAPEPAAKPVVKKRRASRGRSSGRAVRFKANSQSRLIRKGFMGTTNPKSALREIQQILSELGYPAPITGKYDQQTYNAIRSFQKSSGIATDGLVGPITYGKMATAMKGQAASAPGLKESLREEIKRQLEIAMGYDMMEFEAEERARDAEKQDSGALEILQSLIDGGKITADELQDAADMLKKQDGEGDEDLAEGGCKPSAGQRSDDPKTAEKPAKPEPKKPEDKKPAKPEAKKPDAKKPEEQSQKKFAANQKPFDKATAKDRAGPASDSPNNKTGKKEKENKEKKAKDDKDLSKVPSQLRSHVAGKANESKIQTPEQENTLYEQRFTSKNNRLFEKLLQEWAK